MLEPDVDLKLTPGWGTGGATSTGGSSVRLVGADPALTKSPNLATVEGGKGGSYLTEVGGGVSTRASLIPCFFFRKANREIFCFLKPPTKLNLHQDRIRRFHSIHLGTHA